MSTEGSTIARQPRRPSDGTNRRAGRVDVYSRSFADARGRFTPMDTDPLQNGYSELIEYAATTQFGAPPMGEWNAEQVVAHLTANDDLLLAVTLEILDGSDAAYDNAPAVDGTRLNALAAECGGMNGVIDRLRSTSQRLVDAAARLDDAQCATMLHVKIVDSGEVRLDQPIPIGGLLQTQATFHLPNHLQQLRDLAIG